MILRVLCYWTSLKHTWKYCSIDASKTGKTMNGWCDPLLMVHWWPPCHYVESKRTFFVCFVLCFVCLFVICLFYFMCVCFCKIFFFPFLSLSLFVCCCCCCCCYCCCSFLIAFRFVWFILFSDCVLDIALWAASLHWSGKSAYPISVFCLFVLINLIATSIHVIVVKPYSYLSFENSYSFRQCTLNNFKHCCNVVNFKIKIL